ncbi:hypothetical protein JMJ77_0007707 [Colletotrichum scovillei]|uniref:Uncharacterized protein n=1 Tax=Colletotrichum scovillei TaxID=1209932 RepID=A0A9P7RF22_9PEZI|nr:hypothetical protein JMJ77_0007707 [Colletotrichum scovillei]KAG7074687.1 hypothetical protein JMJ76_0011161 [Colletotrichum scovillei]KAG7081926.1 hypothetical protein JMJ78_0004037 [Colletotrichum scovillei]
MMAGSSTSPAPKSGHLFLPSRATQSRDRQHYAVHRQILNKVANFVLFPQNAEVHFYSVGEQPLLI